MLVFTRTKHGANHLAEQLNKDGIRSAAIHGNKSQGARTRALADFKSGDIRVLVATDIAARGPDIEELPHVVNYELPNVPEDYVHRIGRTGRAAATGEALSLVCVDEHKLLRDIEKLLKKEIPRIAIPGYEPDPSIKSRTDPERSPATWRRRSWARWWSRSTATTPWGRWRKNLQARNLQKKPSRRLGDAKPAGEQQRRRRPA
ncbi:helicase-related protein [Escherichia coli]